MESTYLKLLDKFFLFIVSFYLIFSNFYLKKMQQKCFEEKFFKIHETKIKRKIFNAFIKFIRTDSKHVLYIYF